MHIVTLVILFSLLKIGVRDVVLKVPYLANIFPRACNVGGAAVASWKQRDRRPAALAAVVTNQVQVVPAVASPHTAVLE